MKTNQEILTRKFLGTIGNKVKDFGSKADMAFEKAHLKAYLKGKEYFNYGFTDGLTGREPAVFKVKQTLSIKKI